MKNSVLLLFSIFLSLSVFSQVKYPKVIIETSAGNMILELSTKTPQHSTNFIKLVNDGYYDNQLFHRVINHFMIQAGDPDSKQAKTGQFLGSGGPSYTIPAEFDASLYHKRGALAAARQPDHVNPGKESSGSQFYIVHGKTFTKSELEMMLQTGNHIPFTPDQLVTYTSLGGSPHLDGNYTVFGQLVEGFEVLDTIAATPVDSNNRPVNDVRIFKAYTIK